jgi:acetoin utilization deacetylase AcuC-like enzyme
MAGVEAVGCQLGSDLQIVPAEPADLAAIERVHDARYVESVRALSWSGGGHIDPDTYVRADSWEAALRSAGAGLQAVELLRAAQAGVGFVAARPPGHHALASRGMGFCLFNNVAVAARSLADAGERVVIVDWDVHHGNGTQDIFWDDPRVLYVSTHQWPLYPGTGRVEEVGGPNAWGLTVNLPLPVGSTGDAVRAALSDVAAPAVESFAPTWVLVSAGYDAHRDDPLAELSLSAGDFGLLARDVAAWAPADGRMVLFLEGGYDLDALHASVAATLEELSGLGSASAGAEGPTAGVGLEVVERVRQRRAQALDGAR